MLDLIEVPASTVCYAVRYCMGRATYADADARDLIRATWKRLPRNERQTIARDITDYVGRSGGRDEWADLLEQIIGGGLDAD